MTSPTVALRKRLRASGIWRNQPPDLLIECLADPARLASLDAPGWDRLLPQAREAHLLATLYDLLRQQGALEAPPQPVREHLHGAWRVARRRTEAIRWELRCLRDEVPQLGAGRPVLLKGVAYIILDLPWARSRVCGDIDLLVSRDELDRVERMLYWAGWVQEDLDPYDEHYYRDWMHQIPPLMHRRRHSTLDLHHNILPETVRRSPDPGRVVERAVPVPGDPVFATPMPAHLVLHSAVHLFADSEWDKAVRDFHDLDQLIRHFGEDDGFWADLVDECEAMHRGRELCYALRCCSRWFGTPVPPEVLQRLRRYAPMAPRLWVLEWIFRGATAAHACGPRPRFTAACRAFLFVRSHWIKMPPVMLVRHLFHKAFLSPREETP